MLQKKTFKPKKDRFDIYNNLPHGALVHVAEKVGCSVVQVTRVLRGERKDNYGIIPITELIAAINIWNVRFSKFRREIDWTVQADLFHENIGKNLN